MALPAPLAADAGGEPIVVSTTVNGEPKGDLVVRIEPDGDILVRRQDLIAVGVRDPGGEPVLVDGAEYRSLRSLTEVSFELDMKTVALRIEAAPALLGRQVIDLGSRRPTGVEYPSTSSLFLNYRLGHGRGDGGATRWELGAEAGARVGNGLLLTDGFYRRDERGGDSFVRLMSRLLYDRRDTLQRLTLGDVAVSSGTLGGGALLGGIGLSKRYDLDPYVVKNPVFGHAGLTTLPAEVEVLLDGVTVRRERLSPGEFVLGNFSYYGGAHGLEVVVRDRAGNEVRVPREFYFTDTLLRAGLQEYSYGAGFLRRDYGREGSDYGDPAFAGIHRYGLSDAVTAEFGAEAGRDFLSGGPSVVFLAGDLGQVAAACRASRREGEGGSSWSASYDYQGRRFGTHLAARGNSRGYATLGAEGPTSSDRKGWLAAGASYRHGRLGTLGASWSRESFFDDDSRSGVTLSWSHSLSGSLSLNALVRRELEPGPASRFFFGLRYDLSARDHLSAGSEGGAGDDAAALEVARDIPEGEGWGYRARAERRSGTTLGSADLEYHARYADLRAGIQGVAEDGGAEDAWLELGVAGGIAAAAGEVRAGRPVEDAFGLVDVGGLPGVRVYRNGQLIGRTDARGRIFVPRLDAYHVNEITLDDRDLPLSHAVERLTRRVSPSFRQGALVAFAVSRFSAVSGRMLLVAPAGELPGDYLEMTLKAGERTVVFPTGSGGEFYLENLPPGSYEATFPYDGREGVCPLEIPVTEETFRELGTVRCTLR